MENEENRGLNDKKAYEDKLARFGQCKDQSVQFWNSLIILSLSLTLGHLDFCWSTQHWVKKGKEGKRKQRQSEGKVGSSVYNRIHCRYLFAYYFPFQIWHAWYCMWFFSIMACILPGVTVFFSLALSFPDSLDEMGSHTSVELDCEIDLNLSGVDLRNDKHMAYQSLNRIVDHVNPLAQ